MDSERILAMVWTFVNSGAGITIMASILFYGLNRLYAKKPTWAAYEGTIISAIKFAEKAIDDESSSGGMKKLDEAFKYVLKVYQEVTGKRASAKVEAELKDGIGIVHNRLEKIGMASKGII